MGRRGFVAEFPAGAWRAAPRSALRLIDADLRAGSMPGPYTVGRRVDDFPVLHAFAAATRIIITYAPPRPCVLAHRSCRRRRRQVR